MRVSERYNDESPLHIVLAAFQSVSEAVDEHCSQLLMIVEVPDFVSAPTCKVPRSTLRRICVRLYAQNAASNAASRLDLDNAVAAYEIQLRRKWL